MDRAKGLPMQRRDLLAAEADADAYGRMHKTAIDRGLKPGDMAQRVLDVADLLG